MSIKAKVGVSVLVTLTTVAVPVLLITKNNQIASVKAEERERRAYLLEMLRNNSDPNARMNAVGKIEDPVLLAEFASNEEEHLWVRAVVLSKLKDQVLLAKIAKNDKVGGVRVCAFQNLTDQKLLLDIAKTSSNLGSRAIAASMLNDKALGEELGKQIEALRREESARKEAIIEIEHTNSREFLIRVMEASKNEKGWEDVRQAAEKRLSELKE